MCGIFGYFDRYGKHLSDELLNGMGERLQHRGPDDRGHGRGGRGRGLGLDPVNPVDDHLDAFGQERLLGRQLFRRRQLALVAAHEARER